MSVIFLVRGKPMCTWYTIIWRAASCPYLFPPLELFSFHMDSFDVFGAVTVYKGTLVGKDQGDNIDNGHRRLCCSWGNYAFSVMTTWLFCILRDIVEARVDILTELSPKLLHSELRQLSQISVLLFYLLIVKINSEHKKFRGDTIVEL